MGSCPLVPVAIQVIELTMKRLKELNQPFKYIVTCAIMQKNGAGLHMVLVTSAPTASFQQSFVPL